MSTETLGRKFFIGRREDGSSLFLSIDAVSARPRVGGDSRLLDQLFVIREL